MLLEYFFNLRLKKKFQKRNFKKKKLTYFFFLLIYSLLLPKGEQNPPQGGDPRVALKASKSAGAKGDVPKICGCVHPLHPF